jgi:hypothetical protein
MRPGAEGVFAATFLLGITTGVYVGLRGVERLGGPAGPETVDRFGRPSGGTRIALGLPAVAAVLTLGGLVGFIAVQALSLPWWQALGCGTMAAALGAPLLTRLIRRWARQAAVEDAEDPRFALRGHVAIVLPRRADAGHAEVEYASHGRRVVAFARSVDDAPLPPGLEVVIDRVEDDVVFVEPWSQVERRI